jgi:hypothetical protein
LKRMATCGDEPVRAFVHAPAAYSDNSGDSNAVKRRWLPSRGPHSTR